MRSERVSIRNELGERLIGLVDYPKERKGKYPVIVLAHGFGGIKSEHGMFTDLARILTGIGFLTVRFDFSGCGESEGDYSKTSLTKLVDEFRIIWKYAKARPDVDKTRMGTIGMSFGTDVVIMSRPTDARCYALLGSVAFPFEALQNLFGKGYNPEGVSVRISGHTGKEKKVRPEFWKDLRKYDIIKSMKRIRRPVLIIHGTKDESIPLKHPKALYAAANRPKKFVIINGADHSFFGHPQREKMVRAVTAWFRKYL